VDKGDVLKTNASLRFYQKNTIYYAFYRASQPPRCHFYTLNTCLIPTGFSELLATGQMSIVRSTNRGAIPIVAGRV
jgi:hypothetical protein